MKKSGEEISPFDGDEDYTKISFLPEYKRFHMKELEDDMFQLFKKRTFDLSREKYPEAKLFGLTTGLAVMKINSELGYEPVTYSELTQDEAFWAGCKSCVNYDILMSKERKNCMCTAMLYDPKDHFEPHETSESFSTHSKLYERFMKIKQSRLLQWLTKKDFTGHNNNDKPKAKARTILQYFFNF